MSFGNFGIVVKRAWIHRTVFWEHEQPLGQYKPNDCPINVIAINKIARMFIFLLLNLLSWFGSGWTLILFIDFFLWTRHSMEKEYVKRMLYYAGWLVELVLHIYIHIHIVYTNLQLLLFFVVVCLLTLVLLPPTHDD